MQLKLIIALVLFVVTVCALNVPYVAGDNCSSEQEYEHCYECCKSLNMMVNYDVDHCECQDLITYA